MNFLADLYHRNLAKNEENFRFLENHLHSLKSLDFTVYAEKLKVPALVPIGSRIFFRGELKHTNEVTVALGAGYFAKCSLKQAEILRQHRIKVAESKLDALLKEKEYIQNQLTFGSQNVYEEQCQEIVEEFTEEEDKKWRAQHREKVRQYKQKPKVSTPDEVTDEELWNRLEELELQEELAEEMRQMNISEDRPIKKLKQVILQDGNKTNDGTESEKDSFKKQNTDSNVNETFKSSTKLELLQQVIDKQNELKEKLADLRNRERGQSQTEKDLIKRLDEMEQLDDLEDEVDRLDDILENEDIEDVPEELEQSLKSPAVEIKRSVSFADEDDSETVQITFKHSEVEPDTAAYSQDKGITKPSDIYKAYTNLFSETTSILKKTNYEINDDTGPRMQKRTKVVDFQEAEDNRQINKTIVLNDIVEKNDDNDSKYECGEKRPLSLFKKRRQQNQK